MKVYKVALLLSFICIASISSAMITPALVEIKQQFALSDGSLSWLISIFLVGYVIGQLIYGPIADRIGRLASLRVGLVIALLGLSLCLFASEFQWYGLLLFGRFLSGLGGASGLVCTFILINELLSEQQAKTALSYTVLSFTMGVGLSVYLGSILTQYFAWQICFVALIAHTVLMFCASYAFEEPKVLKRATSMKAMLQGYKNALGSFRLVGGALAVGFVSIFTYDFSAAAPVFAQKILHLSATEYGRWNMLSISSMVLSSFIAHRYMHKIGPKKLLVCALVLLLPVLFSLVVLSMSAHANALWFFSTAFMLFLLLGLVFPSASSMATTAIADKSSAAGMVSFINMGAAMLSVVVLGYLPFSMIQALTLILCCMYVLVVMLVMMMGMSERLHGLSRKNVLSPHQAH